MKKGYLAWFCLVRPLVLQCAVPVFGALLFCGALVWAKSDDPFVRRRFRVETTRGKVECLAVWPKPVRVCPVVFYLHGSGGTLMTDGKELRQLAELGMVAVSVEYDQTNYECFDEQFLAVQAYVQETFPREATKETERNTQVTQLSPVKNCAWVGYGLGAQNALRFMVRHPEMQPRVLVRLAGGWVNELDLAAESGKNGRKESNAVASMPQTTTQPFSALLIHGERDQVFPVEDCRRVATVLSSPASAPTRCLLTTDVQLTVLPGLSHSFDSERALVVREAGEWIKARLTPEHPLPEFPRPQSIPFLLCAMPAFLWAAGSWCYKRRQDHAKNSAKSADAQELDKNSPSRAWRPRREKLSPFAIGWGVVVIVLAAWALVETALHLVPPRLQVSQNTLAIAQRKLMASHWHDDFQTLAAQPSWQAQKLGTLLTHVELADYCVHGLVNWKLPPDLYRDYVLSPVLAGSEQELNWRRPLWEFFYPRIRRQNTTEAAAQIVARSLRERVTVVPGFDRLQGVDAIWREQITGEKGFELIYAAALRAVGVPARLSDKAEAEFWDGEKWRAAPKPLVNTLSAMSTHQPAGHLTKETTEPNHGKD